VGKQMTTAVQLGTPHTEVTSSTRENKISKKRKTVLQNISTIQIILKMRKYVAIKKDTNITFHK
jgi:hypothetical protein